MNSINIAPRMAKKSIVRNTSGQIIDWYDESNGGWIIRKGSIVNPEKYEEFRKIEEDKKLAAQAIAFQKVGGDTPDRTTNPSKVEELEKRIEAQDAKLDQILKALQK